MLCFADHYVVTQYLSNLSLRAVTAIIQHILKLLLIYFFVEKEENIAIFQRKIMHVPI